MIKLTIKTICTLLLILAVSIGFICFSHPIISKWLVGNARIIGKPVMASVYTDEHLNKTISVFRDNRNTGMKSPNDYLLRLTEFDKYGMLKYINIDLNEKWIGRPVATTKCDYDIVNSILFQSDVGSHFVDFKDDIKGYNFDAKLTYNDKEIKFNIPPGLLKFNKIRIVLND